MLVGLSDQDLLDRLANFEDHFVERKTVGDHKDWVKTVVAFANSAPIGYPCILYVGVKNSGEIESGSHDLDRLQQTLTEKLKLVYPLPYYLPKIIQKDGRQALAVIVPGSELRPHFSGPAYVRRGSQSLEASEEQFEELIAQRSSKASKILEFKDKLVTVVNVHDTPHGLQESDWGPNTRVVDCNQFWLTLQKTDAPAISSYPLTRIEISFDHNRNTLKLEIRRFG